jgi:hypothetical protein
LGLDYDYPTDGTKSCTKKPLSVKLNGRHCGEIRKVKDGFQYYAKGEKKGADIFASISAVQNHLTASQPGKNVPKVGAKDDDAEAVKRAMKVNQRLEADLKVMTQQYDRANLLMKATHELLSKQQESKIVLNILEEMVVYDDAECDGFSLLEDLKDCMTE